MITCKIKKITKGYKKTDVYDIIGIPDNHNFIANNVVVHNCDESIRFACLSGDALIKTPNGNISIKHLEGKINFPVISFNIKTKKEEIQIAEKCIKTKNDYVYELELENGKKIKCTKEHKFLTTKGWKMLGELKNNYIITLTDIYKIKSIKKLGKEDVYDIIGVQKNNNYIVNSFITHNSSEDWAKASNKELKKKLAQVRTKHLLYILCFPLKIQKVDKVYLESNVNYWLDLFGRGVGALYVKDKNPAMESWRMKEFLRLGSYTEFTNLTRVKEILKRHPNFWQIIKIPKLPQWLYNRYLNIREKNVYDDDDILKNVTKEDIHNALLVLALRDIMLHDTTLTMNRILLHIKNQYDLNITKQMIQIAIEDAKQLVAKVREQAMEI